MEVMDAKLATYILVAVVALVEIAKNIPKVSTWIAGREKGVALLLPVLGVAVAKAFFGKFEATPWEELLTWATVDGAFSGVVHDNVLNPAKKAISTVVGFLFKKPAVSPSDGGGGNMQGPPPAQ